MCISNNSNESPNPAKSKEYYGGLYISPNGRIDSGSWEDLSSGLRATSRMVRPSGSRPNGDPSRRKTRALKRSSSALSAPGNLSLVVFRASIVCALISACAGWVVTGGVIGKVADMFRSVTGPLHAHRGSWTKREECRAAPPWNAELSEIREAVESFDAREYTPPVWARNAHLHTIVASGDMEKKLLGDRTPIGYWRERWPTPDGDFVDIDWLPADDGQEGSVPTASSDPGTEGGGVGQGAETVSRDPKIAVDMERLVDLPGEGREQGAAMQQLREVAAMAERAHGASLGVGHPNAPEEVHEGHPSWMTDRRNGKAGEGGDGMRRLVVLLHGLEGSSTAPLTKRFSSVFVRNGFDVAALNFRGCSGELGKYPLGYHLGFTDDLLHVIEEIHRRFPDTWDRIYLSGFSLGGNVIVKFLGEQGDRAKDLGIYGAAVGCVPFEPQFGAEKLEKDPVGRFLYMPVFLAWLNIKAAEHAKAHPDQLSLDDTQVQGIKTFTQFDSLVTLPVFGFSTTEEYYQEVNAANYLSRVRVPLMVVNAKDDPFIEGGTLPAQETVQDAPVRLVYHNYGGHCGFMSGLLSSVWKDSKTNVFTRKWGSSWGSGWVPWGSTGKSIGGEKDQAKAAFEAKEAAAEVKTEIAEIAEIAASASAAAAAAATVAASESAMAHTASANIMLDAGTGKGTVHQAPEGTGENVEGDGRETEAESGGVETRRVLKEGRWLPTELARFVSHLDESLHKGGKSERQGFRSAKRRSDVAAAGAASAPGQGRKSNSCLPAPSRKR